MIKTGMSDLGYRWSAGFTHGFLKRFTRVELNGIEHVPLEGPAMVCANHISHFDPYYIAPPIPRCVDFMAMEEFFRMPLIRSWLRWANVYPVHRRTDPAATREAMKRLKAGRLLGIFPERGLRAESASMLAGADLPRGTMTLAHRLKVPVVPCVILGSDRLYGWKNWFKSITVWIRYGPALRPSGAESADDFQERYIAAMRDIHREMIRDYNLKDEDLPQNPQRRMGKEVPSS
jgi:1-acyl-sn-glycerol-3-phosphate acyltransferase